VNRGVIGGQTSTESLSVHYLITLKRSALEQFLQLQSRNQQGQAVSWGVGIERVQLSQAGITALTFSLPAVDSFTVTQTASIRDSKHMALTLQLYHFLTIRT